MSASVLIVCENARVACELVSRVDKSGCEVMFAAYASEALERIREFDFAAAVVAWQPGVDNVVAELEDHRVPYFLFGLPAAGEATIGSQPLVVTDVELVVPALVILLSP
jgi:CheY-like chemotaxis protein